MQILNANLGMQYKPGAIFVAMQNCENYGTQDETFVLSRIIARKL
jgi:hypothetical protein